MIIKKTKSGEEYPVGAIYVDTSVALHGLKIFLVFLLLTFSFSSFSKDIQGVVYLDKNNNGIRDKEEPGLKGIVVSDGFSVVSTNGEGSYVIPRNKRARMIVVHQPVGYYVKHYFKQITGASGSYDFALLPREKKTSFSFIHITDTETYLMKDWVNNLKDYIARQNIAFLIHTGDICYTKGLKWHARNVNDSTMDCRVYYTIGNHDYVDGDYGEQLFENILGPLTYSFEVGKFLFIGTPMGYGDKKSTYKPEDTYRWLRKLLEFFPKDQPKIIFNHNLPVQTEQFILLEGTEDELDLDESNLKAWIYGHWHVSMNREHTPGGTRSICSSVATHGGIDSSPAYYRVIHVDEEGNFTSKIRYTYIHRKIAIVSPKKGSIPKNPDGSYTVSVNVYDSGSEIDSVRCSILDNAHGIGWKTRYEDENWQDLQQKTDWNWSGHWTPLTDTISDYTILVEAYTSDNRVIREKLKFRFSPETREGKPVTDWTNLGGNPVHDARTDASLKLPLQMLWVQNAGSNIFMTSPIVEDGRVFIATTDDNNSTENKILAYDAKSGKELWQFTTRYSIKNTIIVSNGRIVATDNLGYTYILDAATGKLLHDIDIGFKRLPGFSYGIVQQGDTVFAGFGQSLSAIKISTGKILWKNKDWRGGEGSIPTMTLGDGVLVTSSNWRALYGHDSKTGKLLWAKKDEGITARQGTASWQDGKFYVCSANRIFVMDPKTGETLKSIPTEFSFSAASAPLVTENLIIVGTGDRGLVAFDKETFHPVWQVETGTSVVYTTPYHADGEQTVESSPVLAGELVLFGASDGFLYAVDSKDGCIKWKFKTGAPVFSSVAISGNMVFVADFAGNVYGFVGNN